MLRHYVEKILEKDSRDELKDVIMVISDEIDAWKETHPDEYTKICSGLEKFLYDITPEEAERIVSEMNNEYGMRGARWSLDEVCEIADKYQLPENICRVQLYVVMNMWNMDYVRTMKQLGLEDNVEAYVMFSCDWLTDSDFGKGKVYKYFVELHDEKDLCD